MDVNTETIGAAIGRIPSGCSILTAEHNNQATGLLVSWVQQASFEPPLLTVALKRGRSACDLIDGAGKFLLNLIGEDPTELFKHFGKGFSLEEDAFSGLATRSTEFGPLIESCIAHIGCLVVQKISTGDHDLYVGKAEAGGLVDGTKPYTHLRKSGFSY